MARQRRLHRSQFDLSRCSELFKGATRNMRPSEAHETKPGMYVFFGTPEVDLTVISISCDTSSLHVCQHVLYLNAMAPSLASESTQDRAS